MNANNNSYIHIDFVNLEHFTMKIGHGIRNLYESCKIVTRYASVMVK